MALVAQELNTCVLTESINVKINIFVISNLY